VVVDHNTSSHWKLLQILFFRIAFVVKKTMAMAVGKTGRITIVDKNNANSNGHLNFLTN